MYVYIYLNIHINIYIYICIYASQVGVEERVPTPRYGHSGIYYGGFLFIFGGYTRGQNLGFAPSASLTNDVWALENYWSENILERRWIEITPYVCFFCATFLSIILKHILDFSSSFTFCVQFV